MFGFVMVIWWLSLMRSDFQKYSKVRPISREQKTLVFKSQTLQTPHFIIRWWSWKIHPTLKNFPTIDLFANVVRKIKLWQFTFNRCNWFTISANYNYKVISLNDKVNDFSFINKEGWWENARDVCDPRAWGV